MSINVVINNVLISGYLPNFVGVYFYIIINNKTVTHMFTEIDIPNYINPSQCRLYIKKYIEKNITKYYEY